MKMKLSSKYKTTTEKLLAHFEVLRRLSANIPGREILLYSAVGLCTFALVSLCLKVML